ncbi:MAG: mechanosensitive ion channel family protein [Candidatus Brockarchaeota archaeon]|nr:mechanosensitive ion channel family protein [Candidatus Brockarchaeota archaeon]MBO3808261.1 mechanosensitive ion channel family protein [Candidatus Brockarchaeota archaeon]
MFGMNIAIHWASLFFQLDVSFIYDFLVKMALAGSVLLVTLIVSKILGSISSKAVSRLGEQVAHQVKRAVSWVTWLIGILVCLDQLGLELTILLIVILLGGVMLIAAVRDILLNIAAREALAIYSPFKIGDWVQIDEYFGRVIDINLMNTVLVTLDNEVVNIPNSRIVKDIFVNRTNPGGIRIHIPLTLENTIDFSRFEDVLKDIGNELKDEFTPDSKPEFRVVKLDGQALQLEILLRINNPAKSRFIASEVLKRVKIRLEEFRKIHEDHLNSKARKT